MAASSYGPPPTFGEWGGCLCLRSEKWRCPGAEMGKLFFCQSMHFLNSGFAKSFYNGASLERGMRPGLKGVMAIVPPRTPTPCCCLPPCLPSHCRLAAPSGLSKAISAPSRPACLSWINGCHLSTAASLKFCNACTYLNAID